jgi:hypothetical protein
MSGLHEWITWVDNMSGLQEWITWVDSSKEGNIEACKCTHHCSGKAISVTYCGCVFIALGIQHAMRMRHIVNCGLSVRLYNIFSTFSHKRHDFRKKITEHKMCFDFLYNFCVKHFSFQAELSEMWYKCVPVCCTRYSYPSLVKLQSSR